MPTEPRDHVAEALTLESPNDDHTGFLPMAQALYASAEATSRKFTTIAVPSHNQHHPSPDHAPHTMSGTSKGYTRTELATIHDTNTFFLPQLFLEKFTRNKGKVPMPHEFQLTYTQAHQRCVLQQREFSQAGQTFLRDYEEDLQEEYLQQVDAAIKDMQGDDFFESSTPEEVQAARDAVMDTAPVENFHP